MKTTNVFLDTEFTGLHQQTTLISIGLVADTGQTFYAELTDYDVLQIDDWLKLNVIEKLRFNAPLSGEDEHYVATRHSDNNPPASLYNSYSIELRCNSMLLKHELTSWLEQFERVDIWSDCLAYDWVLFNNIFGTSFDIPTSVNYIPFDICTLFQIKGIDPDTNRLVFVGEWIVDDLSKNQHNALYDAHIIRRCYDKLMNKSETGLNTFHITFYPDPAVNVISGYNHNANCMQEVIQFHKNKYPKSEPLYIVKK